MDGKIDRQTDWQKDRQRGRQTDWQRDRETKGQADRHRSTEKQSDRQIDRLTDSQKVTLFIRANVLHFKSKTFYKGESVTF